MKDFFNDFKNIHFFNIVDWYNLFYKHRILHFLFTGGTGVIINLVLTAFFAELVFGREKYFYAYLIGLFANLIYNFTLHTIMTFRTQDKHKRRFAVFIAYSLLMTYIQASIVKLVVDYFGVDWYLIVIATTIAVFSIITFIVLKLWLFNEKNQ